MALSEDFFRSQSALPWLPLWGSCHEVTERVKFALSDLLGHLSHRERQVALIRLALAQDARATYALWYDCHWQSSQFWLAARSATLSGEGLGERIVTGGNPWKGPRQSALH